jgi:hypothetical protein
MVYVTIVNVHAPTARLFLPHCARRKPIFVVKISSWHIVETVVAAFNLLPQEWVVLARSWNLVTVPPEPYGLLDGVRDGHTLGPDTGNSNRGLLLGTPRDGAAWTCDC